LCFKGGGEKEGKRITEPNQHSEEELSPVVETGTDGGGGLSRDEAD